MQREKDKYSCRLLKVWLFLYGYRACIFAEVGNAPIGHVEYFWAMLAFLSLDDRRQGAESPIVATSLIRLDLASVHIISIIQEDNKSFQENKLFIFSHNI